MCSASDAANTLTPTLTAGRNRRALPHNQGAGPPLRSASDLLPVGSGMTFLPRWLGVAATAFGLQAAGGCTTTSLLLGAAGVATDTSVTWELVKHVHGTMIEGDDKPCVLLDSVERALRACEHLNRARVRPRNGPNQGARRSRGWAPAKPCNAEWSRSGASPRATKGPFQIPGPGYPRALGYVATQALAASPGRASRLAQGPGPPRRGHDSYVHKL